MLGRGEDLEGTGLLDRPTRVHHQHSVSDVRYDAQVVCDQQDRHLKLPTYVIDDPKDRSLSRYIERGGRFIGEQETWLARDRHRDDGALRHPARHLVWVLIDTSLRIGDADKVQELERSIPCLFCRLMLMALQYLPDLATDRQDRVQGGHRLLEDGAYLSPAELSHPGRGDPTQVFVPESNLSRGDFRAYREQSQHGHREHGLAAARFPNHRQDLAPADGE
jgi:hypothetical protein